jgi:hypothetical protein
MKKTKHSEEKIIGAVKQLEAGRSVKELARELEIEVRRTGAKRCQTSAGAGRGESRTEGNGWPI